MDLTTYFKHFKAMQKVVKELNQSTNGRAVIEILCWEQSFGVVGLGGSEKTMFIADGKERLLGM